MQLIVSKPSSVVCLSVCQSVTVVSPAKMAEPMELPFGLRTWVPKEACVRWGPYTKVILSGKGRLTVRYTDSLPWAVQKWLNQSSCHFGMGSGELKEACVRLGARWRNLVNTIEPAVYGGDAAFLSDYFDHLVLLCMVHYCRNMWIHEAHGEYFIRLNVRVSAYQSAFRYSDIIMLNTKAVGVFVKRCVMMANLSLSRI